VELRQDVRAPDVGFDPDRIGETDLRREQQLFDKAYEGVLLEILPCTDGRRLVQIRPRGVDIRRVIGETPGYDAHLLRTGMSNGDIHLSFQ
jgi:hypothetical protein